MTVDPFAYYDAAYALGALDAADQAAYEAHLAVCARCRADLADANAVVPLLAGMDDSIFVGLDEIATESREPAPDTLLPTLMRAVRKDRMRRRSFTAAVGAIAAACAVALIVVLLPSGQRAAPTPQAMTPLLATPVSATVSLQPARWGTEIRLTCWYDNTSTALPAEDYQLVAFGVHRMAHPLGSWRLTPGQKINYSTGVALPSDKITRLAIEDSDGTAILALTP